MLLMMLTSQVTLRGAPLGPAPRSLHWLNETVAADTVTELDANRTAASTPIARTRRSARGTFFRPMKPGALLVKWGCIRGSLSRVRGESQCLILEKASARLLSLDSSLRAKL